MSIDIKLTKLPNGAMLVEAPNPFRRAMACVTGVGVGSRHEAHSQEGLSHFLEHLLFKGSAKYPNSKVIAKTIDGRGGYQNAHTHNEMTSVQVQVATEDQHIAADLCLDVTFNPLLPTKEINKERPVVCEEIAMYAADDSSVVWDENQRDIFPCHTLGLPIVGRADVIRTISPWAIRSFHAKHYNDTVAVALAGNFDEKTSDHVKHFLSGLNLKSAPRSGIDRPVLGGGVYSVVTGRTPRANMVVSFSVPSDGELTATSARAEADLLANILGGYMSSRLFEVLRNKQGLCYSVSAYARNFSDCSVLSISLDLEPENVPKALSALGKELLDLRKNGPTAEEVETAVSYAKGALEIRSDGVLGLADDLLYELLVESPGEISSPDKKKFLYSNFALKGTHSNQHIHSEGCKSLFVLPVTTVVAPKKFHKVIKAAVDEFTFYKLA